MIDWCGHIGLCVYVCVYLLVLLLSYFNYMYIFIIRVLIAEHATHFEDWFRLLMSDHFTHTSCTMCSEEQLLFFSLCVIRMPDTHTQEDDACVRRETCFVMFLQPVWCTEWSQSNLLLSTTEKHIHYRIQNNQKIGIFLIEQCFDTVRWATGRESVPVNKWVMVVVVFNSLLSVMSCRVVVLSHSRSRRPYTVTWLFI